ncbi:hypothetical protein [Paenibacillus chitinolyticus]|uniref:hypothetical protein n=1 Tax=Paenibacillus chitinolyticus TaxID=79263 RepID=UPI0036293DE7
MNEHYIQEIINEWNPIEIEPLVDDEYSFEIEEINNFISQQKKELTITSLRDKINEVFIKEFERFFTKNDESLDIAKKIMKKLSDL